MSLFNLLKVANRYERLTSNLSKFTWMVKLGDVSPTIWDNIVEQMEQKLVDIGF